ncbi:DUF1992 domain-containing protein [uncultured Roseovarius sp.]|uniref:DnaJ family domain-containing protein n=1 Tax=uncultured Roseovarius sp. TaxID=293344 RepID=UPI0026047927|nr:DUF1992 domain-containing protein [uncultured Roseovarius sp.]
MAYLTGMSRDMRNLIERQIQKARLEGRLDGLEGEGKPLPEHPEEAYVSTADAAGFRVMAEAGVVPEEIQIKKLITAQREYLASLTDEAARKTAMAELAKLEMRYGIATEARKRFMKE